MVRKIVAGDARAVDDMVLRHNAGISIIISRIVRGESAIQDGIQTTFRIAQEKIKNGYLRDSERLSGFLCSIARHVAIEHVRQSRHLTNQLANSEALLADAAPNQLRPQAKAETILQVINELKETRDRDLLIRYYLAEEDKEKICADLGVGRKDFNRVVAKAVARYKELYLASQGRTD